MTLDQPTDADRSRASAKNIEKMWKFNAAIKVGTASERLNRLYIINIDIISKHFGERWAKVSQKVNVIVERLLQNKKPPCNCAAIA